MYNILNPDALKSRNPNPEALLLQLLNRKPLNKPYTP